MPTLYIVATPIGNLEDISLRALRILREVNLIAAEDTRKTRGLLAAYNIHTPVTSYHEHSKWEKLSYLLDRLVDNDIALVSEAGMPGISDPGYELVNAAIQRNISVVPIPGASAIITAIAIAGLPTDQFTYLGFLPRRSAQRRSLLQSVADQGRTLVALESPHRLLATLRDLQQVLGDRRITACRELTKLYEEVFRGTISEAIEHFPEPKGEFTLAIEGRGKIERGELTVELKKELRRLRRQGMPAKEAVAQVAEATGLPKRELYQAWIQLL